MDPATVENEHRRFDCAWDATTQAGADPRADVTCLARQLDATVACSHGEPRAEVCIERARASCSLSAAYERAARECQGAGAP